MLPGSNDSKQMCLTVCLGSPGLKFCLLHSDCFLHFLSVSPPSVPPSPKGVPGRACSRQAGPGPTGYSAPAGLFLSVSICKMPVVLSECFSRHKCWLGRGPAWKPWWQSFQSPAPGNAAGPEGQAEEMGSRMLLLRGYLNRYCHQGSPVWVRHLLQSVGLCQHALVEQAWRNRGGLARRLWAWLAFLFSAAVCPPPPNSLGILICVRLDEGPPRPCPETDRNPQGSDLQTFKIMCSY